MPSYQVFIKQYGVKTFLRREEGNTREDVVRSVETELGIRERGVVIAQEYTPPEYSSDTSPTAGSSFSPTAGGPGRIGHSSPSPDEIELEFLREQNKSKMYDTILSSIDFLSDVAKRVIEAKKAAKL